MICSRVCAVIGRPHLRAVPLPDAGVQHAQVVVDLGDRADGRARVLAGRLLRDRDRRAQAADVVDVGLGHLAQELPGEAGQAFDVAPLPFGIERVERQRALARPADAGEADQLDCAAGRASTSRRLCSRAPLMTISEAGMFRTASEGLPCVTLQFIPIRREAGRGAKRGCVFPPRVLLRWPLPPRQGLSNSAFEFLGPIATVIIAGHGSHGRPAATCVAANACGVRILDLAARHS